MQLVVKHSPRRGHARLRVLTVAAALAVICVGAVAAKGPSPDIELASTNTAGTGAGDNYARGMSFNKNGRYVVFFSESGDLVPGDDNGKADVFVRDLKKGTITLVSMNAAGTGPGDEDSESPAISANGRYVAFRSRATDLVPGAATGVMNVYRRDLKKSTTVLASVSTAGTVGTASHCHSVTISGNGRYVVWSSSADDLLAGVDDTHEDVFVRDMKKGVTMIASATPGGASGNGSSRSASVNANGRYVAFQSDANDLTTGDANGSQDVYVRDMRKGTTTLVSVTSTGTASGGASPSISGNGRHVAFRSSSTELVELPAGSGEDQAFLRDVRKGVTRPVSINAAGTAFGDSDSEPPRAHALSANGRFVVIVSYADDLEGGPSGGGSAYLRDMKKGTTALVSVRPGETAGVGDVTQDAAISGNGRWVGFATGVAGVIPSLTDTNGSDDVFVRRMR